MFGNKIKELRLKKGLTQQQMANAIGTVQTTYSGWEKDKREPSYDVLKQIANYLNVPIDYLLDNDIQMSETKIAKLERLLDKEQRLKLYDMCKIMFPEEYKKVED